MADRENVMSNPTPKFVVGEEVFAAYESIAPTNTEITNRRFYKTFTWSDRETVNNVWVYKTIETDLLNESSVYNHWVSEERLHKLPPEDRISWEDCAFNPTKIEEEAQ
jgi:hypothetical protein